MTHFIREHICFLLSFFYFFFFLLFAGTSAVRQETKYRIDGATKDRAVASANQELEERSEQLIKTKKLLATTRSEMSESEAMNAGMKVKLQYAETRANSMKGMHEEEVVQRVELQRRMGEEEKKRRRVESELEKVKEKFYVEWLEREGMIDQMEIERVVDGLIGNVVMNVERERREEEERRSEEEREVIGGRLSDMLRRVSILPPKYQRKIFLADQVSDEDNFYDLMERQGGDEEEEDDGPSLADGCQSQVQ